MSLVVAEFLLRNSVCCVALPDSAVWPSFVCFSASVGVCVHACVLACAKGRGS